MIPRDPTRGNFLLLLTAATFCAGYWMPGDEMFTCCGFAGMAPSTAVGKSITLILPGCGAIRCCGTPTFSTAFSMRKSLFVKQMVMRASLNAWATAKDVGKQFVPSGKATQAFDRLMASLQGYGIHVVEVGEVESFVKSVGNHGPKWVNEALKEDLNGDAELGSRERVCEAPCWDHIRMRADENSPDTA